MNTIDLIASTERALELLAADGLSAKSLQGYMHTGFGCIKRYFHRKSIVCVTEEMLDDFVLTQYEWLEQKKISKWKWRLIRRSSALLKLCAVEDSVDLSPLPPWQNSLRRPRQSIWKDTPTAKQLEDPENIFALVWKTNRAMSDIGLTEATVRHYRDEGLSIILKLHYEAGMERFSEMLLEQIVLEKRLQYESGQTARVSYQNLRKAARWIQEMHMTGEITQEKLPNWGHRELTAPFEALVQRFCLDASRNNMTEQSLRIVKGPIRGFLLEMEDHGFKCLADFSRAHVNECVTSFTKRYTAGLNSAIYSVRLFLRSLFESNLTDHDLSLSLPEFAASRKMFHEGFAGDELSRLLEQPDRTSAIGKRDYAMIVLAAQSGLRACDIVRLDLSSIHWRARRIHLIQHKTGEPLSLPLEPESGNAIADYILNGRPKTKIPTVFLCHTGAVRPLNASSASGIVAKYMKFAGIPAKRRAFHALRRTFGTRLLQNGVSFELIQQLLGHRSMDSMKPYLSIDERGLKMCALPLLPHGEAGGNR